MTDFGLARVTDESVMSKSGELVGTWAYMSPEQVTAKREGLDGRSDVFSLGAVLYELLTLQRPFQGDMTHQIASQIIAVDLPDADRIRSQCPCELAVVCGKALEKEPNRRYASIADLASDLRRYLADEPVLAKPPTAFVRATKWANRHPAVTAAVAIGVLALVIVSLLSLTLFREGERHALGEDGRIRVIARDPGGPWRSVALLEEPGVDLRDPKLSRMPDGRVMLLCGGSVYEGSVLRSCRSRVYVSERGGESFGAPRPVVLDEAVRSDADWLWRVTWVEGEAYGVVYQPLAPEPRRAHLVATKDGVSYRHITTFDLGDRPTEVALREVEGGDLLAIVRHDGKDRRTSLGRSAPPFEAWRFQRLGEHVGGPDLLMTGRLDGIVGGRRFSGGVARTALSHLGLRLDGQGPLGPPLVLPSAGDTSYPGMVRSGEELLVSYYSSHEGRTAIYLATLEPLTESGR